MISTSKEAIEKAGFPIKTPFYIYDDIQGFYICMAYIENYDYIDFYFIDESYDYFDIMKRVVEDGIYLVKSQAEYDRFIVEEKWIEFTKKFWCRYIRRTDQGFIQCSHTKNDGDKKFTHYNSMNLFPKIQNKDWEHYEDLTLYDGEWVIE